MRAEALGQTVVRIEAMHVALVAILWLALAPVKAVEPTSLLAGGIFMGINFLLLSSGIRWVLTAVAGRGRVGSGFALLFLKMAFFLGARALLLTGVRLEPLSFTL